MAKQPTKENVTVINEPIANSLVPEAAVNLYQGVNALCRTFRKTCESTEKLVEGCDDICTKLLTQQKRRIDAEMLAEA